jgi:predicted DNA-binding protein (MmcQ/YjbR family)
MTSRRHDPIATVKAAIEAQPGAVGAPLPSPPGVIVYKVMGKIFAILEDARVQCVILKCDPPLAEMLREKYAGIGHRSHLDRRFWIAVGLGADVPSEEVEKLIAHSHAQVVAGLTRKQRAELEGQS